MKRDSGKSARHGAETCGRVIRACVALLAAAGTASAVADEYHYNSILIGDRASGLAGAYTAISDDASGLFYNPAGIVYSEDLQLSASANAVHATSLKYKDVLRGGDWERESSNIVPNFFGMTSKFGGGYIGFSYAVTEFEVEDQDTLFTTIPGVPLYVININNTDKITKLGPSYARRINDEWNFGITLYLHDRERELINNQFVRLDDNSYEFSNLYFETSETGVEPILGLMWAPQDSLSIGISVRKTYITSAHSRTQVTCASDVNNPLLQPEQCLPIGGSIADPTTTGNNDKRELPLNIRLGVAYFPSPRLLYTADISYYEKVRSAAFDAEEVVNYAFGVEYYLSALWALRGGYYTNHANTPELSADLNDQSDHVDLDGFSLSATRFSRSSSVTIGLAFASGKGEAQVISGSDQIQELEQTIRTLYLSTSYNF